MRMRAATAREIRFSCLRFHYARSVPSVSYGYSFFLDEAEGGDFIGCVLFGGGANRNIGSPYGLAYGEVIELVRVALNGKQGHGHTSQVVMMAIRQLKRDAKAIRLVISYADEDHGHVGKIYQATNWVYTGEVSHGSNGGFLIHGKEVHKRTVVARYGTASIDYLRETVDKDVKILKPRGKLKYVYPLDKRMRRLVDGMSKPYPKVIEDE